MVFQFILQYFPSRESNFTVLIIKFKENEFTPLRRFQQFTFIDFLSYIGGLLGLFAGISVLSFFEIFYFCVPRLLYDTLKNKIDIDS